MVDYRHAAASSEEDRVGDHQDRSTRASRSPGSPAARCWVAACSARSAWWPCPAVVLLADLGPWPTRKLIAETIATTIWKEGIRLVNDVTYVPIKAEEIQIGQLVNAQPENLQDYHGTEFLIEKAKASIIIVRMDPNTIKIPDSRKDWHVGGILCYSKICTHVGCPISLWEQQTHHLLCPCHQSTFDLGDSGVVVFGPAARSLPQLPITADAEGYLVARGPFSVPTGPSYFERDFRTITNRVITDGRSPHATVSVPTTRRRCRRPHPRSSARSSSSPPAPPSGPTTGSVWPSSAASSSARCSPTTGRSCWVRSRSTRSSSCCSPASS